MSLVAKAILGLVVNPDVRTVCGSYIEHWMLEDSWQFSFVSCIRKPEYSGRIPRIDEFVIDLHNNYHVDEGDCESAAAILMEYVAPNSVEKAVAHIQEFVRTAHITNGIEIIAAGSDRQLRQKGIESIKHGVTVQIAVDTFCDFSDVDYVDAMMENEVIGPENVIPSSSTVINKSLTYKGYKRGDLVCVAAASGVGKSTWLTAEGTHFSKMGYRVAHIVLGDLSEGDMFLKYLSAYNEVDTSVVLENGHRQYMQPEIKSYFQNVRVKSLLPDTYDVYQLLSKCDQLYQKFPYDVLIIDYDGNIKEAGGSGNSYLESGQIYANLKGHAQSRNCLVYVASQTKIQYWNDEIVTKVALNDSSKKQMHLDVMIGIGKNKDCPNIGKLNLAKVRRGQTDNWTHVHLDNGCGIIREIPKSKYEQMLHAHQIAKSGSMEFNLEDAGMTGADTPPLNTVT